MKWDSEVFEQLLEKPPLFVVDTTLTPLASLPRARGAVKDKYKLDVQREETAETVEHGFLDALKCLLIGGCYGQHINGFPYSLLTFTDHIDLLSCEVVEAPIRLVDSDSKRLAMTAVVIFSELRNRHNLFVASDCIPKTASVNQWGALENDSDLQDIRW